MRQQSGKRDDAGASNEENRDVSSVSFENDDDRSQQRMQAKRQEQILHCYRDNKDFSL